MPEYSNPISRQLALQLKQYYRGGNWTGVSLKEQLDQVSWEQAIQKKSEAHSIAELVYHINYYLRAQIDVLSGHPLTARDELSFDLLPITNAEEWEAFCSKTFSEADELAGILENFPDSRLHENFADPKYGSYFRNVTGLIEHCHYHLGQITLLRKLKL